MSARPTDDTVLVGPVVVDDEAGLWGFVLLRGRVGRDDGTVGADCISATNPSLLEAARSALIETMRQASHLRHVEDYDDELTLALAGAVLWPRKFESLVALAEIKRAGGGIA